MISFGVLAAEKEGSLPLGFGDEMKSSARIDSAVFQLTPTRTRCDLVILANGRAEKIATGLLNPFLAHLKAARDQMAVGGYSIELKPEPGSGATWFTKGTLERFVRFVSTPEILERVDTLESEILQIEEAIALQSNKNGSIPGVDEHHGKLVKNVEAAKPVLNSDDDKAIVLYKLNSQSVEANGSTVQEGNSKVDLRKVLETRRNVLRKEQGMAFARAVAAGFGIDIMDTLISFAQCFGAARLMDACKRFLDLWKKKHESGQWLEIEAAEATSAQSDFMAMNGSGIVLADASNEQMSASENNGDKSPTDQQVPLGHHENFQGQYPSPVFPPWQFQPPSGAPPGYPPYPMAPMPYYPNYPANGPYFHPVFSPVPDQRSKNRHKSRQKGSSLNEKESPSESEASEKDSDANNSDESDAEKETKMRRKKHGSFSKKKSGMVVIRNINYISSKEENGSDGEANSASGPGKGDDEVRSGTLARNGNLLLDKKEASYDNEIDVGHWQAFQNFLLKDSKEDSATNKGMFSMEKGAKIKRHPKRRIDDPLSVSGGDVGQYVEDHVDNQQMSGGATYRRRASADEMLISRTGDRQSRRGSLDAHPNGVDGRRSAYRGTVTDDFMVQGRDGISSFSLSDLSSENRYKSAPRGSNSRSSYNATDDGYIVSLRSNSFEAEGTALDISEFPSGSQRTSKATKKAQPNYEPDYSSLVPERVAEKGSSSYDPAIDYEMQARRPKGFTPNKSGRAVAAKNQDPKKEAKDQKMKLTRDAARTTGPIRKGKPTRLSPLDEARARAERMRSYKADLQKVMKEKEEEQLKRLETLKRERQKRIVARSSSVPGQLSSLLARKNMPNKLSPSPKPSKFTDAGQSSSSPLQRSTKRTVQVGTNQSEKVLTAMKLSTVKQSGRTRLSRSVPSLNEELKDSSIIKPDAKTSMARIRRLSEPKMTSSSVVPLVKPEITEAARKRISRASDGKPVSAIISLDKSKAASLPELKIRTPKPSDAKSVITMIRNKRDNTRSSYADDCSVVDKTVVMLEPEKPYAPSSSAFQDKDHLPKKHHGGDIRTEKQDPLLYNVNRPSSNLPTVVKTDKIEVPEQICDHQVKTYSLESSPGSMITQSSEKPYQAPYARNSSLEDRCTANSEYCKVLPAFRSTMEGPESVKVHATGSNGMQMKKMPETVEKQQQQESSSKGFRKLWNFSRKSSDSASSECIGELDYVSVSKSDADDHASQTVPSNEAYTLKNLIHQDETPTAATTPKKSSRSFSLLSPFRSKSGEKKNVA